MGPWFCGRLCLICKLLHDATFTWQPRGPSCWLKKWLILGNFVLWTVHVLEKVLFYCSWVPWEINSHFCRTTQWRMFLLVLGHHVGAQHGISIQISINLGKTFLHISYLTKVAVTWILARGFAYLPSFFSQILDLIFWAVLLFIPIYSEKHWKAAMVFFLSHDLITLLSALFQTFDWY